MKEKNNLEKRILDLVNSDNYHPLKPKAIAKKLKLLDEEREVKRTIKRLVKKSKLAFGSKHLVTRISPEHKHKPKRAAETRESSGNRSNEVVGRFRRAAAGFGFVTPSDSTKSDRSDDIFIPKSKTADAADRDIVKIRFSSRREGNRNRTSGRVIEVVERNSYRFVGTYQESGKYGIVVCDGGIFENSILVGDAGAKNCKIGDKVVIEVANFPSDRQSGEGVIVEVLGDRGTPGVDTLSVIRQYGLPEEFPEEVLDDARHQADEFDEQVSGTRTDFTNLTVITIDPKTARDFDDAISLERLENGHWRLGVHIADVSHFVPLRSKLDREAYARATSIYLPDRVIPMLPEIISNNLASLQPGRVRYCMTAMIEFTDAGVPIATELYRGAIKSVHRFTYEDIDQYLENPQPWKKKLTPEVFELVGSMHSLAMTMRKRRMDGGSINLILPEVKIDLDENGKVAGAHTVDNTESHQVIEEFMLAANEAVARRLNDDKLFYMRRVHPHPSESKLDELTQFVKELGIECESLKSRFEVKRVIQESEGMPQQHAIHYAVLRSMQKAVYSPEEIGHYALNSDNYCHFTSPIRRYPDLIIHRMVGDLIDGKKPDSNFDRLAALGKHCSELEKRASDAERDLTKLKLLNFMAERIGHKMDAVITGVESFGVFAQGIEIPAEGLVPLANLPDDSYRYERETRTLAGFKQGNEFRLGDRIRVQVALVDPDQRQLEFEIVGVRPSSKPTSNRQRPSGSDKQQGKSRPRPQSDTKSSSRRSTKKPVSQPKERNAAANHESKSNSTGDEKWESQRASGSQTGHKKSRRRKPDTAKNSHSRSTSTKKKPAKKSNKPTKRKSTQRTQESDHSVKAKKKSAGKKPAGKNSKARKPKAQAKKKRGKNDRKRS